MEVWIGGNDLAEDDKWVWTDGDLITGDLWASDRGDGDCMIMKDFTWFQRHCEGDQQVQRRFLAQKGQYCCVMFDF